jgi:hypothetical protein
MLYIPLIDTTKMAYRASYAIAVLLALTLKNAQIAAAVLLH